MMSTLKIHTAIAGALLALALVQNPARAGGGDDETAAMVVCKDGTTVTGSKVAHAGRAECSGRGGVDVAATKAARENAAANAPPNTAANNAASVQCKDGTTVMYTGGDDCGPHGGMDHLVPGGPAIHTNPEASATAPPPTAGTTPPPAEQNEAAPGTQPETSTHLAEAPRAEAAPGGGPGKVWVNTESKVYHCPGDHMYGKTAQGEYMTEADAKAQGFRPLHNKACE